MSRRRLACRHRAHRRHRLQHKLAHVLGGLGLPHAETHAIILPHVTRFNSRPRPTRAHGSPDALGGDPAEGLPPCCAAFRSRRSLSRWA